MHNFSGVISGNTLKKEIENYMMEPWIQESPTNPLQVLGTKEPLKKYIEKKK